MRLNECSCGCGGSSMECMSSQEGHEPQNYMFMGNLEIIKRAIDAMLQMDPMEVDEILSDGHNWAADHIATSKDDIEEVAGFLMNRLGDSGEMMGVPMMGDNMHSIHTFESFSRGLEESDNMVMAKVLNLAVRVQDWDLVKKVSFALKYKENYGSLPKNMFEI